MVTYSMVHFVLQNLGFCDRACFLLHAAHTYDKLAGVQHVCSAILCMWPYRMLVCGAVMYVLYTMGSPSVSGNDYVNRSPQDQSLSVRLMP